MSCNVFKIQLLKNFGFSVLERLLHEGLIRWYVRLISQ